MNKGTFICQLLEQEEERKATFPGPTKFQLQPRLKVLAVFNLHSREKIDLVNKNTPDIVLHVIVRGVELLIMY